MVTETVETTEPVQTDPEPQVEPQTETPAQEPESAAAEPEAAAVPQVEAVEEKPSYLTREEWEKEKTEVAQRAAAEALETERRKRQTEGARKAQAEERQKARLAQTVDTVRATLVARGLDPEIATEESVVTAIDRVAQERAESILQGQSNLVGETWDYVTAKVYGKEGEWDESYRSAAQTLAPRIQHLIDTLTPQIESKAREGYTPDSDLPKKVDEEIARRAAKGREGQTELQRPEGQPAPVDDSTIADRLDRIGTSRETPADRQWWNEREKARGRG